MLQLPTPGVLLHALATAWSDVWQAASTSPWIAIVLMVAAVGLLVRCTRVSVHRG